MSVCVKCNEEVTTASAAKCCECGLCFHPGCLKGGERKFQRLKDKSLFCCALCKEETASNKSDTDPNADKQAILRAIAKLDAKVDSKMADIQSSISGVREDLTKLSLNVSALQSENEALKMEVSRLQDDNKSMSSAITDLYSTVAHLEQYSRTNNVVVYGVPATRGEDVYEVLRQAARALGVVYEPGCISIAHRLRSRQNQCPAIIVCFISRRERDAWLAAARSKKIDAADIMDGFKSAPVFFREHLTAHNNMLLSSARTAVKDGRLAFAWVRNGKVLVRKEAGDRAFRINNVKDLDNVLMQ